MIDNGIQIWQSARNTAPERGFPYRGATPHHPDRDRRTQRDLTYRVHLGRHINNTRINAQTELNT